MIRVGVCQRYRCAPGVNQVLFKTLAGNRWLWVCVACRDVLP